ncbi:hypothetical protein [Eubacterium aggregans]|uniref:hypothetical protein n=1 Tax=Eubacterium aggregans TaxID=81409 RepID=UPI003F2E2651
MADAKRCAGKGVGKKRLILLGRGFQRICPKVCKKMGEYFALQNLTNGTEDLENGL